MAIDIFLFILLVVITALGYRNGFIYTLFHTLGWLISLLIGFVFTPMLKKYMIQSDIFYTSIKEQVLLRMPGGLRGSSPYRRRYPPVHSPDDGRYDHIPDR